jgi:uncharacterized membrane protein YidH (DUF202 family)
VSPKKGASKWRYLLVAGFVLDLLGMFMLGADLVYDGQFLAGLGWLSIMTGVVIIFIGLWKYNGEPAADDERISRIRGHSAYWTLIALVAAMCIVGVLQLFTGLVLDGTAILAILLFIAAAVFIGLNVYYDRKGDI